MTTQRNTIASHLKARKVITPLEALSRFRIYRLAARIHELREDGWNIHTDNSEGYATYRLIGLPKKARAA